MSRSTDPAGESVARGVIDAIGRAFRQSPRRRLASILYADVCGYSRLMEEDEEGTHARLVRLMDSTAATIGRFNGRVSHFSGDAVLAWFADVLSSLECALAIQAHNEAINDEQDRSGNIRFRIGLNLGEVICDRGDIFGNEVNLAARLEKLSAPGGIVVSESVRIGAGNRLALDYAPLGEQRVKNFSEPVKAYRLQPWLGAAGFDTGNIVSLVRREPHSSRTTGAMTATH